MIHDKQEVSFHVTVPGRYVPVAVHFSEVSTQAYLWQHKYNIFPFLSSKQLNDKDIQHLSFHLYSMEPMQAGDGKPFWWYLHAQRSHK